MYAAHAARSAVHHEVDQYEDDNVGVQALSEGEKAAGNVRDISKSRYARKLKKKAKMQGKKAPKPQNLLHRSRLRHKMQAHPHQRGRLQLALPVAAEAGHPAELLCRRPVGRGADRRR